MRQQNTVCFPFPSFFVFGLDFWNRRFFYESVIRENRICCVDPDGKIVFAKEFKESALSDYTHSIISVGPQLICASISWISRHITEH